MPVEQSLDHCTEMPVAGLALCSHKVPAVAIKVGSLIAVAVIMYNTAILLVLPRKVNNSFARCQWKEIDVANNVYMGNSLAR